MSGSAATLYVWQDSPSPGPPYATWATAAHVIQDAVDAAVDGDTVLVSGGVYDTGGRAIVGLMTNRVAINGAIMVESLMGPQVTVIAGAEAPGGGNGDGAIRCVYVGSNAVLSGFTLTNGQTRASGDYDTEQSGGGVWAEANGVVTNCVLTGNGHWECNNGGGAYGGILYDCIVTDNWAWRGGGAFAGTLSNCTLAGNWAGGDGGGAYGSTLYDCTLSGNDVGHGMSGSACVGGGACQSTLSNCTLSCNWALDAGGGACDCTLLNCTLTGNSALHRGGGASGGTLCNCILTSNYVYGTDWDAGGGAVAGGYYSPCTLYNCTLTGNSANSGGGAYEHGLWPCTLYNCTLTGNSASFGGGASGGTLYNCNLTGNSADAGGGVDGGTLYNCTLTGNSVDLHGYLDMGDTTGGGASGSTLYNCILRDNHAVGCDAMSPTWIPGGGGGAHGCTLYNCIVSGNWADVGGGASGCTLYNCTLTGNSVDAQGIEWRSVTGGGASGSTLYNCTLTGNSATGNSDSSGGGASGSTLYNCTLTGNSAQNGGGVAGFRYFWEWQPCALYNCIVYHNTAPNGANYSGSTFAYSCTTPLPEGEGNIDEDPELASTTHLSSCSPCVGAGSSAYASGVDIDGEPWADPPCMGADQVVSPALGSLAVQIEAAYRQVGVGYPVRFVAHNQGPILATVWDFGDGTVVSNQAYISHGWSGPGNYTVTLTGYNDSFPAGVTATVAVQVTEAVYYVKGANATPEYPYTSWETAATSIQEAIEAGTTPGRLVWVSDGVYDSGGVVLTDVVMVRSVNGPGTTVIDGGGWMRCADVGNDSILSGFMLTNGAAGEGGGVWCEPSAVVSNCVLTGNAANGRGGGAYGGTLCNCTLTGNSANEGGGAARGTLYNCTLTGNAAEYGGGGACYGTLYNCTLTGNSAGYGGGASEGTLYNCIVYHNTAPNGANYCGSTSAHSCTTPLPEGEGNIDAEPMFKNAAAGDFRLAYGSPCIDTGANLSDLITTDLDRNLRPLDGNGDGIAAFDMGAYEYNPQTADSNGDTIPDWWCHHYCLDPTDAGLADANPDNDGQTTYQEWIADTDPTNALAWFHIERIEVGTNGSPVTIHFLSSSNRVYSLRCCADLGARVWTDVPGQTARPGSGGLDRLSDTNAALQRFYRMRVDVP